MVTVIVIAVNVVVVPVQAKDLKQLRTLTMAGKFDIPPFVSPLCRVSTTLMLPLAPAGV
jgi:hypothetical protein